MKWIRQEQERGGKYYFSGRFVVTSGIQDLLSEDEVKAIYLDVQNLVKEKKGIDYLVVYVHEDMGQKLFFSDQLDQDMLENHPKEHHYCTLLLAEEW